MMDKHVFGFPVTCGTCGKETDIVYALTWSDAVHGSGQCEACFNSQPAPETAAADETPAVKPDANEAAG